MLRYTASTSQPCMRCHTSTGQLMYYWRWKGSICSKCEKALREKSTRKKWEKDLKIILRDKAEEALKRDRKERSKSKIPKGERLPRRSKEYRKARALENAEKKRRQKQKEELLRKIAAERAELEEHFSQKNAKLRARMTLPWIDIPTELEDFVEHSAIERKYFKFVKDALKRAHKKGFVLEALLKIKVESDLYTELGEIEDFETETILWHGTKVDNLKGIFSEGFRLPSRYGLLGRGIYTTPEFDKAWNFTGWKQMKPVLLCDLRLGKVLHSNKIKWNLNAEFVASDGGFHSAFHGSGFSKKAWRGLVRWSEYCVYDPAQICPRYLFVFTR